MSLASFLAKWGTETPRRHSDLSRTGDAPTPPRGDAAIQPDANEESKETADTAVDLLNRAGVRVWYEDGVPIVGIWSDLDSEAIRDALRRVRMSEFEVRWLDGPNVPLRLKLRTVPEETEWISPAAWKAEMLNQLFAEQGVMKQRGRITEKTVLHGEAAQARRERER